MTATETLAAGLYVAAAVFAIAGPALGALRVAAKYREAKQFKGSWNDFGDAFNATRVRAAALRDAVWGVVEFGFVAIGVVLASAASIILIAL